ncbi:DUF58 domain-containing protein [Evansella tamaricis]|uniref:DUF58 domain-containing protein n=1 Tax=Evansella tamaricis TaxID=2069301 RepID=A0ABS6JIW6_9BACI|nr:DUF58 domain-containing protein [Evansella tamaricis]MBU9713592.1 DUF58 domain-containing protein [Evansella tamaricis]
MIQWRKEVKFTKRYYVLTYLIPLFIFLSLITNEVLLFSLTVLFILVVSLNTLYLSYVSKRVAIPGEMITKRLFTNDQAVLKVPFENRGRIPIFRIKASLFLYDTDHSIEVIESENFDRYYANYEHPFSIPPFTKRNVVMNMKATKRGTAELRTIEVDIYDLFLFGHIKLTYEGPYRGEAVVYPTPQPIKGLEKVIQHEKGNHSQPYSLYEDVMMTRGNREYGPGDPFNRINWKASARTDYLQTKVYEKVTVSKWTIVLNIKSENPMNPTIENLESVLSQVAYACHFATTQHISYELYVNLRIPGSSVGIHLPLGEGKNHLGKTLELLARIRKSNITIPVENMLHHVTKNQIHQPYIIHFGANGTTIEQEYAKVKSAGGTVYFVTSEDDTAYLSKIGGHTHEKMAN